MNEKEAADTLRQPENKINRKIKFKPEMFTRVPTMEEFEELKRSLNEWVPWMEDRVTKLEEENKRLKEENERQNWKITDLQRQLCSLRAKLRMGLKI